jgi:hypothetical protein
MLLMCSCVGPGPGSPGPGSPGLGGMHDHVVIFYYWSIPKIQNQHKHKNIT